MKVYLHRSAEKYKNRLKPEDRKRLDAAFSDLEKEPPEGDIVPYEGSPGVLRLKVGGYRAIFKYEGKRILVTHIEPRGQAYTKRTKTKRG